MLISTRTTRKGTISWRSCCYIYLWAFFVCGSFCFCSSSSISPQVQDSRPYLFVSRWFLPQHFITCTLIYHSMEIDTFTMHLDFEQSATSTEENAAGGETGKFVHSLLCSNCVHTNIDGTQKCHICPNSQLKLILFFHFNLDFSTKQVAAGCALTLQTKIITTIIKRAPCRYITTPALQASRQDWKR